MKDKLRNILYRDNISPVMILLLLLIWGLVISTPFIVGDSVAASIIVFGSYLFLIGIMMVIVVARQRYFRKVSKVCMEDPFITNPLYNDFYLHCPECGFQELLIYPPRLSEVLLVQTRHRVQRIDTDE